MIDQPSTPVSPRWLHALAVLTVLFTLPLLFLGASVTSHGVGMIDPRGFRWPWEIIRSLLENNGLAWLLEYSHRTLGFLVGLCGIGLAVGCWFFDRPSMRWAGVIALAMIGTQGLLGGFRVDYNALHGRSFAMVHGIFAQIVFAVLVSIAVFTSGRQPNEPSSPGVQRWSIITLLLVLVQLILGGVVRHTDSLLGPRGHLLGAFVVTGAVLWLLKVIRDNESHERFKVQRILLMSFLTLQLLLGIESWLAKFYVVGAANQEAILPLPLHSEWIRTAHYLVGTLIFSTTVVVALKAIRKPAFSLPPRAVTAASKQLEAAL